jgi:hypothetical protein
MNGLWQAGAGICGHGPWLAAVGLWGLGWGILGMGAVITASMLYNLVTCPKRVALDLFGEQERRDPISPFVQLLWERGNLFEKQTIFDLDIPFFDLSEVHDAEKERLTRSAMERGETLIYSGQISADGLLGVPDLLRKTDGGYVPGDIKAGAGWLGRLAMVRHLVLSSRLIFRQL